MKKVQGIDTWSVDRREFLELTFASSLISGIPAERGDTPQKAVSTGTRWMDELPIVISEPRDATPLYNHRTGGRRLWEDQDWEYAFTEKAAKEMKDMGVTLTIVTINEGYGFVVERSYIEKFKAAAGIARLSVESSGSSGNSNLRRLSAFRKI